MHHNNGLHGFRKSYFQHLVLSTVVLLGATSRCCLPSVSNEGVAAHALRLAQSQTICVLLSWWPYPVASVSMA